MDKFWLRSYPPGIPAEIDPDSYPSLKALIEDSLQRYAAQPAFIQMGRTLSYAEVDAQSRRFGAWLQDQGLRKGDRVAIMMPNLLQYPVAMFGALRAGMTVVNVNPLYTAEELRHQLADSEAVAIVVLENFCGVLQQALPATRIAHVIVTAVGDLLGFPKRSIVNFAVRRVRKQVPAWTIDGALRFNDVLADAATLDLRPVEVGPQDLAYLQYTGGTTGISKGAMLTHRNMVANTLQSRAWHEQVRIDNALYVIALPLYHIFSLTANCLLYSTVGGTGLMVTNPRDFPNFVKELLQHPPNVFNGVNTLFNALMNTPGFERIDFRSLVATMGGGMAVQGAVAERWKRLTGCELSQGWGLTETSPVATVNPLKNRPFDGSIGLPIPSTEISIRDDSGVDVGIGKQGEICVRGPQVMAGYWNRPDETAKVMLPDGWLRTGDIGHINDNGYVFLEDRKKDMILVSGFNVYPNEIEAAVATHPGVFESAAVAQADEHSGEAVALFVVRKDPNLTSEQLIAHLRQTLTSYKLPKHVYFAKELPKTNVGKILRRQLRDGLALSKLG
jgi:long-chain acyl-CoA synthetase